jgi:hypothetical protein
MEFSVSHAYDCDVATLHAILTDPAYLEAKFPAIGFHDVEVLAATPGHVEHRRVLQAPLPGFARKVLGESQTIVQIEDWTPDGDRVRGRFRGGAQGTPITMTGTLLIEPRGAGALLSVRGKVEVKIPLLGGKIAALVADKTKQSLEDEYAFTQKWVAEH